MHEIVWTGSDEHGYVGKVNGIQLYAVKTVACAAPPRRKNPDQKYLYFPDRRSTGTYGSLEDTQACEPIIRSAAEAKALCAADFANGGAAALQEILDNALTIVKAAGFCVSKPKSFKPKTPKPKNRVGPTFVAHFRGGEVTRMSTFTSLTNLDVGRGLHLSQAAYEARARRSGGSLPLPPPPIVCAHFEQDGVVLATYDDQDCSGGGA
jgi:hypothetical protein